MDFFLQSMEADPCLDDSVMFARKLRSLGVDVSLNILAGLPHGFLNLILVNLPQRKFIN